MLGRLLLGLFQIQFVFLLVFLLCAGIAGEEDAPFWFALVCLTMLALTFAWAIARRGR